MKNRVIISIFAFLLHTAAGLNAQIRVDAPSVVGLDEQFKITFTLSEKPSGFEWSQGDSFQLVWGPQTGSSTSISIVNGKTTKSSQYTYTYVLIPRANGNFSLPAAHAVIGGRDVYSKAPRIEVVGNGSASAGTGSSQGGTATVPGASRGSSQSGGAANASDLFMKFSLSRTSAVVGEPITATLKLYTRVDISGFEDAKFPSFNGFWAQETESPQNISFVRESVDDRIYNAAVLRKWVIIPQKTGAISIEPAELICLVQERISYGGGSIFDGFFDDFQTTRKRVTSAAYTVNVNALPAGAPASFTGAVGAYSIKAKLNTDSLKVHDAASLTVTVTGKGNVALIGDPKVKFPPDSEVYDTKTSDRIDAGSGGMSGSKIFEYPFIPRSHGEFEIEPIEFTYYDIKARKYVTLTTGPIPFSVAKGKESDTRVSSEGVSIPVNNKNSVKNLNEDIRFISTKVPQLSSESTFIVGTPLFWTISILILVLGAAAYYLISTFRKNRADKVRVKTKGASKVARKRLAAAGDYLEKNLYTAFYEELHKALLGYASDKMNIGLADMSKDGIADAFAKAGVGSTIVSEYISLLDACEYARYSPSEGNEAMKESYDKAAAAISDIESAMKSPNIKKGISGAAMSALIALMLLPVSTESAYAQTEYVDSLWNKAVSAYSAADYKTAQETFCSIEELGLASCELYTNIADSYYKSGMNAQAILYYERALKLDPSYKDAKYNLEIVRQKIQDRIESVPEFFLTTWSRALCYSFSSNVWTVLFFVFMILAVAALLLFLLARSSAWRKTGFFTAISAILISIVCLTDALWQKREYESRDSAIVYRTVSSVRSAPSSESGSDLFIIHEGTKVLIIDTLGEWINISIADGREGWLRSSDIEII